MDHDPAGTSSPSARCQHTRRGTFASTHACSRMLAHRVHAEFRPRPPGGRHSGLGSGLAAGAGAALALVHRGDACHRDRRALGHQLGRERLRWRHQLGPRIAGRRAGRARCGSSARRAPTSSSSSHGTGNDTGTPGRTRGLYAAATVAPPVRVASTNTLPPRSALTNAVVATSGSSSSARRAIARVAAAAVVGRRPVGDRHEDVHALRAAALHRTGEADVGQRPAHEMGGRDRRRRTPSPSGGSRSRTRCVGRSRCAASANVGWYSTARWLANHSNVRRSLHSA